MKLTPTLDARGVFEVREPFKLAYDSAYRVGSVRSVSSMEASGMDVYREVYAPVRMTPSEYQTDLKNNPSIVELISDGGQIVLVPDTFISKLPEIGVPVYHRVVVSVDLGMLPESMDLTHIQREMSDVASGLLGVRTETKVHHLPFKGSMTKELHDELEDKRRVNRTEQKSVYTRNLELEEQVRVMSQHIIDLQAMLN